MGENLAKKVNYSDKYVLLHFLSVFLLLTVPLNDFCQNICSSKGHTNNACELLNLKNGAFSLCEFTFSS